MVTKQKLGKITIGLLVFDVICIIIATAIDQWMATVTSSIAVVEGLWAKCELPMAARLDAEWNCKELENGNTPYATVASSQRDLMAPITRRMPNVFTKRHFLRLVRIESISRRQIKLTISIKCVRAMVLLGLFFVSGATLIVTAHLCHLKDNKQLLFAATGLLIFAGLFLMIGFGVFHAKVYGPRKFFVTLHAGFAFCVIAWIATMVGMGLTVKLARMGDE